MPDIARLCPHPALRATFSQREKGSRGVTLSRWERVAERPGEGGLRWRELVQSLLSHGRCGGQLHATLRQTSSWHGPGFGPAAELPSRAPPGCVPSSGAARHLLLEGEGLAPSGRVRAVRDDVDSIV